MNAKPGKNATVNFRKMKYSSVILLFLIPFFVFTMCSLLGQEIETVRSRLSQPGYTFLIFITLVIGLEHFRLGAHEVAEDYVRGSANKILLFLINCFSYGAILISLIAIIRLVRFGVL